MKKRALLFALLLSGTAFTTNAQTEAVSNKNDVVMTPEADDWAISVDATPFLNYFGNMLSSAGNSAPTANYANGLPWAIRGKMFVDENTAYRVGVRLGFGSTTMSAMVDDYSDNMSTPPTYPTMPAEVEDTYKAGYNGIVLTGGMEMRRGKTRLQGYYGGELLFGMSGTSGSYTYGNAINTNTDATRVDGAVGTGSATDWGSNGTFDYAFNDARITSEKASAMTIGLRGFIGAEYFIIPKMSLGFEYGWGLGLQSSKTSTTYEALGNNGTSDVIAEFTDESKASSFAIDSDIMNNATGLLGGSGSINLTFHF